MRSLLLALLLATPVSAQNIWQMNNAYQQQFNNAYAQPYVPVYTPRYYAPVRSFGSSIVRSNGRSNAIRSLDRSTYELNRWSAEQDQLREMRQMNRTLQLMEWDLQDAARRR
jgi:hypothetical protein